MDKSFRYKTWIKYFSAKPTYFSISVSKISKYKNTKVTVILNINEKNVISNELHIWKKNIWKKIIFILLTLLTLVYLEVTKSKNHAKINLT